MTLFDRLKQMLHPEDKSNDKIVLDEGANLGSAGTAAANQEQLSETEKERRKLILRLTPREHELYLLLLEGYTLKESAKKLCIKYSTANTHMTGVYKKLGVNSRAELIIRYRNIN